MVEADPKLLADEFKKACMATIDKQNQQHNLNQEKNALEIQEAKN